MKQNELKNRNYVLTEEEIRAEYLKKDISDDFIFGKVMQKEKNCIPLLERLTGNRIESVEAVVCQKAIRVTSDSKGVRYDIYVEDDKGIMYDAEMQKKKDDTSIENLSNRARFYQGLMDLNVLESGEKYKDLKESYVIFICTFDPFGLGLSCYEFENICKYDKELTLNDGRIILFFNTKGKHKNVNKQVADLLHYIETKQACDEFTRHLDAEVEWARQNKEWMVEYMKTLLHDMDVRDEGRQEGIAEGEFRKIIELTIKKMNKQKSVVEIADELEENIDTIQKIYDTVLACGLEADVKTILKSVQEN